MSIDTGSQRFYTWNKPRRGYTMVHMICMGWGGGGGGGFGGAAACARGGGGGGAGSSVARLTVPLVLLPDALTINVGNATPGGAAGIAGTDGIISTVCGCNAITLITSNVIVTSSNGQPQSGNGGTATAGGAGGAGGAVAGVGNAGFSSLGLMTSTSSMSSIIGQAGTAGGAHTGANGTDLVIPVNSSICGGGAGGAGVGATETNFRGGIITPVANSWLSEQISAAHAAGSVNGPGGTQCWKPFFSFGGYGGSSSDVSVGGHGGNGAYGAGGGGGGGGTTGGTGGNGGPGLVIIICW